jgi:3-hydroxybutyryl-CoA dehydratase
MTGKSIDQIQVGDSAEFTKTVSESDVYLFAGVTGDLNPAHINESYAEKTFFKGRIAHGMLPAGFISAVLGTQLPGPGTIYIRQELNFLAPVRMGDTITARVEATEVITEKKRVRFKTTCTNQEGAVVLDGEAIVSPPKAPKVEDALQDEDHVEGCIQTTPGGPPAGDGKKVRS